MGSFQASVLEAFQSLRDKSTTKKKHSEVDQTSASASKPGTSTSVVNLDPPAPRLRTTSHAEEMDVDYGEVDTFRRILSVSDLRDSMPRSSTSVIGLDDEKGRQELRLRGPSSMLPLSSVIKDAFDKFEHDFQAANLREGKYLKPPPSSTKWDSLVMRRKYRS